MSFSFVPSNLAMDGNEIAVCQLSCHNTMDYGKAFNSLNQEHD
jgi:hypothetical protein